MYYIFRKQKFMTGQRGKKIGVRFRKIGGIRAETVQITEF